MKKNKLHDSEIAEFAEFNTEGDSVYGKFTGTMEGGKGNDVALFQTGKGTIGVNVYESLRQAVQLMEIGEFYMVEFLGLAKSKKSKFDYFKFDAYEPEPETEDEKEILNAYYKNGTFNINEQLQQPENNNGSDAPF